MNAFVARLEKDLLWAADHRKSELSLADDGRADGGVHQVLDRTCPDERPPRVCEARCTAHQAGGEEHDLCSLQSKDAGQLRSVYLAADEQAEFPEVGVEDRELVSWHPIEVPVFAALIDPRRLCRCGSTIDADIISVLLQQ